MMNAAADENYCHGLDGPEDWLEQISCIWNMVPVYGPPPDWDVMSTHETDAYVERHCIK